MHQTDILVIGGGIAGTATTCYLSQYGHEVTLLEQSELAAEASGLNAGTIWASGWGHTPDLSSTLSMGSLEIFKTLQLINTHLVLVSLSVYTFAVSNTMFEDKDMVSMRSRASKACRRERCWRARRTCPAHAWCGYTTETPILRLMEEFPM